MMHILITVINIRLLFLLIGTNGFQRTTVCMKNSLHSSPPRIFTSAKTFRDLVTNSDIFVDKSLLLNHVLNSSKNVTLINYPRKWGKTLNLDMIREFLEINVDENGNKIVSINESFSYRLFKLAEVISSTGQIQKLNNPLLISKDENILQKYQGKYPVIYLDLSGLINNNYAFMFRELKNRIHTVFVKHSYMLKVFGKKIENTQHDPLAKIDLQIEENFFQQMLHKEGLEQDVEESLVFLSEILYKRFNQKVFILIDGYDDVLRNIIFDSTATERAVRKILAFFSSFYTRLFQGNLYLEKGILTGICSIVMGDLRSSLNSNDGVYKFENDIIQFYGFTEANVDTLFNHFNLPKDSREIAHDWCGGYREGKELFNTTIYNPWCTINFLNQANSSRNENYECQTINDNIEFLNDMLLLNNTDKLKNIILSLIRGYPVSLSRGGFQLGENVLISLRDSVILNRKVDKMNPTILSFLYMTGYLTIGSKPTGNNTNPHFTLGLPNKGMMKELSHKLMLLFQATYHISPEEIEEGAKGLVKYIEKNDGYYSEEIQKTLEKLLNPFCFVTVKQCQRATSLLIPLLLARIPLYIIGSEIFHTKMTEAVLVYDKQATFIRFYYHVLSLPKNIQKSKEDWKYVKNKTKNKNLENAILKYVSVSVMQNGTVLIMCETDVFKFSGNGTV